jgi:hypothetical protein
VAAGAAIGGAADPPPPQPVSAAALKMTASNMLAVDLEGVFIETLRNEA